MKTTQIVDLTFMRSEASGPATFLPKSVPSRHDRHETVPMARKTASFGRDGARYATHGGLGRPPLRKCRSKLIQCSCHIPAQLTKRTMAWEKRAAGVRREAWKTRRARREPKKGRKRKTTRINSGNQSDEQGSRDRSSSPGTLRKASLGWRPEPT